jgi:hypothetical protein
MSFVEDTGLAKPHPQFVSHSLSPEHLRGEMAKTERSGAVEPDAGTKVGQSGQNALEVVESTDERRGSSVAEQLIRNQ